MISTHKHLFAAILFLFCLCESSFTSKQTLPIQEDEKEIFEKLNEAVKAIKSIHFSAEYRIKFFANKDTTSTQGECWFRRNEVDSFLGFEALIQTGNRKEYSYSPQGTLIVDHNTESVLLDDTLKNGINLIKGNIDGSLIFSPILNGINWAKLTEQDSVKTKLVGSEETDNYWIIELAFPDEEDISNHVLKLWIYKNSYLPFRQTSTMTWKGMTQYKETKISNLEININTIDRIIENFAAPDSYAINYPNVPSKKKLETLEVGKIAPTFALPGLGQDTIRLSDYKGKVILLDFWYMSCYPCVKALPHLEELHQTYKNHGLEVIGVNSPDNPKRLDQLSGFLLQEGITYPTVIGDYSVDNAYKVKLYPTLYLIDQQGRIAYSQLGFSESMLDSLGKEIEELLGD